MHRSHGVSDDARLPAGLLDLVEIPFAGLDQHNWFSLYRGRGRRRGRGEMGRSASPALVDPCRASSASTPTASSSFS
jgi:hypothetical protein